MSIYKSEMLAEINPEELSVASSQVDGQLSDMNDTMIDHQNTTAVDDDTENLLTPHQSVKKLKSEYHENYNRKFAFEKAEFHQCIPNPMIPGGFITV